MGSPLVGASTFLAVVVGSTIRMVVATGTVGTLGSLGSAQIDDCGAPERGRAVLDRAIASTARQTRGLHKCLLRSSVTHSLEYLVLDFVPPYNYRMEVLNDASVGSYGVRGRRGLHRPVGSPMVETSLPLVVEASLPAETAVAALATAAAPSVAAAATAASVAATTASAVGNTSFASIRIRTINGRVTGKVDAPFRHHLGDAGMTPSGGRRNNLLWSMTSWTPDWR